MQNNTQLEYQTPCINELEVNLITHSGESDLHESNNGAVLLGS